MRRTFTLLALCLMATATMFAQTVTPTEAAQKAKKVFNNALSARSMSGTSAEPKLAYTSTLDGTTCFYVFNNPQGGYAIIGGDQIAREVLAVVDHGTFDINKIPGNVKFMLEDYAHQIKNATGKLTTPSWTCGEDVAMLMSTTWDQGAPYSNDLPKYDTDKTCATGCVATAAAQAVFTALKGKFTTGKNSKTFSHTVTNSDQSTTTASQTYTATDPIDWDMIDSYADGAGTEAQQANVAKFMQIMGIISEMSYGNESGTTSEVLTRGLWNNLGIAAKFKKKETAGMSDQQWEEFVYAELAAGRPVIFGADTPNGKGGHEFVVDGYQKENDNFHVNWGWGGSCDGYYALTGTTAQSNGMDDSKDKGTGSWMWPAEQGAGGSSDTTGTAEGEAYRNGHEAVYNLVMRGPNEANDMPEVDASDVSVSQEGDDSSSSSESEARKLTAEASANVPDIYVGDGTEATSKYTMTVSFGKDGVTYDGSNASFVWGVELDPVDENDSVCYILDATNKKDEPVTYKKGDVIKGFTIPVGEYSWSADGSNDSEGEETMKVGKYSVIPIMYFDPDGDSEYIADENIAYVATPHGWKAPVVNLVLGAKKTTGITTVNADAATTAGDGKFLVKGKGLIIVKHGKKYNAAGQRQ